MQRLLALCCAASLTFSVAGCTQYRPNPPGDPCATAQGLTPACWEYIYAEARPYLHITVGVGVSAYLREYPDRAVHVVRILREVQQKLQGSDVVLLQDLQRLIERRIDWQSLSPAARAAVQGLMTAIRVSVEEFLLRAGVAEQERQYVRLVASDIIGWGLTAAEAYCTACIQEKLPRL